MNDSENPNEDGLPEGAAEPKRKLKFTLSSAEEAPSPNPSPGVEMAGETTKDAPPAAIEVPSSEQEVVADTVEEKPKEFKVVGVYQPKGELWGKDTENDNSPAPPWQKKLKKFFAFFGDLFLDIVIVLAIVIFIRVFVVSPFKVSGDSMKDTYHNADFILVDQISYRFREPQKGDVIVFTPPTKDALIKQGNPLCFFKTLYARVAGGDPAKACLVPEYFVKRIIGAPGDTVEIKNGKVYLTPRFSDKQTETKEPYLSAENKNHTCLTQSNSCATTIDSDGKIFTVPDNSYFVLGDNRRGSNDGRYWKNEKGETAFVPFANIRGKVQITIWPFNRFALAD